MTVNQRQFDQLTEMGISLWQHKSTFVEQNSIIGKSIEQKEKYLELSAEGLTDLTTKNIFTDILQILGVSIGEVSNKEDHLDLGVFNWYFNSIQHAKPTIECADNNLISPSLQLISQSPELKKQLWQIIAKNLL